MNEVIPTFTGDVSVGKADPKSPMFLILDERARQNDIWGIQRHSWPEWMSILTEEVGEAAREANLAHWEKDLPDTDILRLPYLREELVQTAAVAVQIIEHIDELIAGDGGQ